MLIETLESRQLLSDIFGSIDSSPLDPAPESVVGAPISAPLRSGPETIVASGTVLHGQWKSIGSFAVAANGSLTAKMTGTGDADLYVRRGAPPTPSTWDCRPYTSTSNETCMLAGGGTYYVAVQGYGSSSSFNITISYNAP